MAVKTISPTKLVKWCDKLATRGELTVRWDGGNDSGSYQIYIDDVELGAHKLYTKEDEDCEETLYEIVSDNIGYGSFAGDFYTEGTIIYDPVEKCFTGEDNYSEDDDIDFEDIKLHIDVPKNIWFNKIVVEFSFEDRHDIDVAVQVIVDNGPFTSTHTELEKTLETSVQIQLQDKMQDVPYADDITGGWNNVVLNLDQFKQEDDKMRTAFITEATYRKKTTAVNEIHIDLKEAK